MARHAILRPAPEDALGNHDGLMAGGMGMTIVVVVLAAALTYALVWIGRRLRRESLDRRRSRAADRQGSVPIEKVMITAVHPDFALGPFGPARERTEVVMTGGGGQVILGSTTDYEAWILAVLAKRVSRMFEFGTCTGRTAYLWARNSAPDATITTLTLGPKQQSLYQASNADLAEDGDVALEESDFETFLYTGSDVAYKVEQLFGDSKQFDESPYLGQMDLIFVDGSHAYSYVVSDTRKALRMVRPSGLILWHDYEGPMVGRGSDVALVELARELPLFHIIGTRMVGYRGPLEATAGSPR
jgi:hypothetical protein